MTHDTGKHARAQRLADDEHRSSIEPRRAAARAAGFEAAETTAIETAAQHFGHPFKCITHEPPNPFARFAAGPWRIVGDEITTADNVFVASVAGECATDEQDHNARLIAAAPQLLAALRELLLAARFHYVPMIENHIGRAAAHACDEAYNGARAAIRAALADGLED